MLDTQARDLDTRPVSLPRIIVGTARMGSPLPDLFVRSSARERAFALLDGMVEIGCAALDLAASYMVGGTERLVGEWLGVRKNRDRLFLISKGGHPLPVIQPHRLTASAVASDLHASLKRLRTERIDLYLLHRDDESAKLEPLVDALKRFEQQGKVGAWGVSNWTHTRIRTLAALAHPSTVAASSPHFSLLEWVRTPWRGCVSIAGDANVEARAFYEKEQLPVIAWSPLGNGFFSDKPRDIATYASPVNVARRGRAEILAKEHGRTASQIALAYLFSQPFPVSAVIASSTRVHMKSNLDATSVRLSSDDLRWLETGSGK